ncbi:hypothetical protein [Motilibacter deserti]|uniref:Lipoprotein n=1 Tax=Motilibacter deserti TaxID=2714956 RepID=A0ABX0GTR8_9ACTN|nr:hypothetical protein [Motilibacter deserti]NHC14182.1 hypothetical protein [Motilibacter deserti]
MSAPRRRRSRAAAVVALSLLLLLSACSVSVGDPDEVPEPELVEDGKVTLDLRARPTREALGLVTGDNGHFEDRATGSDGIEVTVLLPTGSVRLRAFGFGSESLGHPQEPVVDSFTAPPSSSVVNTNYPSLQAAAEQLYASRDVLGLDEQDLATLAGPGPEGGGSGVGVIEGLRAGWLEVDVELRGGTTGGPNVNYLFRYYDSRSRGAVVSSLPAPDADGSQHRPADDTRCS